jgi:hypothetical protein
VGAQLGAAGADDAAIDEDGDRLLDGNVRCRRVINDTQPAASTIRPRRTNGAGQLKASPTVGTVRVPSPTAHSRA